MEATCSSETSVDFQRTTRCYIPKIELFSKSWLFVLDLHHQVEYEDRNKMIDSMVQVLFILGDLIRISVIRVALDTGFLHGFSNSLPVNARSLPHPLSFFPTRMSILVFSYLWPHPNRLAQPNLYLGCTWISGVAQAVLTEAFSCFLKSLQVNARIV
jgi:hypothetical protein